MTRDNATTGSDQWAVLAGARFILALCVVILHSTTVAPNYFISRHFWGTGYPAVFGFFMISGYSIAASLEREPKGYFLRRVKRIYPTYLCALAFTVAIMIPGPLHLPLGQVLFLGSWQRILGNVFMLQGIAVKSLLGDGPIWTLSIEWWCYMLAPLLIARSTRWTVALIAGSLVALVFYMRRHGYVVGSEDTPIYGLTLFALAWAWLTGFAFYRRPTKWYLALMVIPPLVMFEEGTRFPLASVVIVGSALAVYFCQETQIKSRLVQDGMKWLGNMSYPLYLFHAPLLYILTSRGIIKNGNYLIVAIVAIVSVGYFICCRLMRITERAIRTLALRQSLSPH